MAEVGSKKNIDTKRVIELLYDNGLLDPSYVKEQALCDLNSNFIGLSQFEEEEINQRIVLLPTLTQAKISNRSDLMNFLSSKPEEIAFKYKVYKECDETISLKEVKDIGTNPAFLVTKLEYCKMFGFPYCDDNGELFEEVSQDSLKSKGYLKRFYSIYFERYDKSRYGEYNYILEGIENDPLSELFSMIQNLSLRLYGKFVSMPSDFEKAMSEVLKSDEDLSKKNKLFLSFSKLQVSNPFINPEDILAYKTHDDRDEFRGQR